MAVSSTKPGTEGESSLAAATAGSDHAQDMGKATPKSHVTEDVTASQQIPSTIDVDFGKTSLVVSSSIGSEATVSLLLDSGANPNVKTEEGKTALDFAGDYGFFRIAQLLINRGADISCATTFRSVLEEGKHRLDVDAERPLGRPGQLLVAVPSTLPNLSKLSFQGDDEAIRTLLISNPESSAACDVEEGTEDGRTPFLLASLKGHHATMGLLLSYGANIDATTKKGWTALMLAARQNDLESVRLLLSHCADANHLSPDRWTALAEATSRGHIAVMELLLKAGADTESKSQHDWTPLMHAAFRGDVGSVNLLLEYGAVASIESSRDETAILLASAAGSLAIVEKLLEIGCPVEPSWASPGSTEISDAQDDYSPASLAVERSYQVGWTPLMLACQSGSKAIVELLLGHGASMAPRSPMFKTALDIARESGRSNIVNILELKLLEQVST